MSDNPGFKELLVVGTDGLGEGRGGRVMELLRRGTRAVEPPKEGVEPDGSRTGVALRLRDLVVGGCQIEGPNLGQGMARRVGRGVGNMASGAARGATAEATRRIVESNSPSVRQRATLGGNAGGVAGAWAAVATGAALDLGGLILKGTRFLARKSTEAIGRRIREARSKRVNEVEEVIEGEVIDVE